MVQCMNNDLLMPPHDAPVLPLALTLFVALFLALLLPPTPNLT